MYNLLNVMYYGSRLMSMYDYQENTRHSEATRSSLSIYRIWRNVFDNNEISRATRPMPTVSIDTMRSTATTTSVQIGRAHV